MVAGRPKPERQAAITIFRPAVRGSERVKGAVADIFISLRKISITAPFTFRIPVFYFTCRFRRFAGGLRSGSANGRNKGAVGIILGKSAKQFTLTPLIRCKTTAENLLSNNKLQPTSA